MSVYFAQSEGYVKIGCSANPLSRASTITTAGKRPVDLPRGADVALYGWVPGDWLVEAGFHSQFAADHVAGEWFYISVDVVRDLIWSDPRGVDIQRMSALAVFAALEHPQMTRDDIARAGIRIEATGSITEALSRGPFAQIGELL